MRQPVNYATEEIIRLLENRPERKFLCLDSGMRLDHWVTKGKNGKIVDQNGALIELDKFRDSRWVSARGPITAGKALDLLRKEKVSFVGLVYQGEYIIVSYMVPDLDLLRIPYSWICWGKWYV